MRCRSAGVRSAALEGGLCSVVLLPSDGLYDLVVMHVYANSPRQAPE